MFIVPMSWFECWELPLYLNCLFMKLELKGTWLRVDRASFWLALPIKGWLLIGGWAAAGTRPWTTLPSGSWKYCTCCCCNPGFGSCCCCLTKFCWDACLIRFCCWSNCIWAICCSSMACWVTIYCGTGMVIDAIQSGLLFGHYLKLKIDMMSWDHIWTTCHSQEKVTTCQKESDTVFKFRFDALRDGMLSFTHCFELPKPSCWLVEENSQTDS